jgi:hypothetical protein
MVGDLDLMVDCMYKKSPVDDHEFSKRVDQERSECKGYYIESLFYPYVRAMKRLKNRSRTVSLHEISEFNNAGVAIQSEQVFEDKAIGNF